MSIWWRKWPKAKDSLRCSTDCLETADQECLFSPKQRAKEEGYIHKYIHPLVDMAEDEGIFKKAPPILFGDDFAKEWEEIRIIV